MDLQKGANIAQILSLLGIAPAAYCAYGTWVLLHPGTTGWPVSSTGLLISFGAFIACAVIGGVAAVLVRNTSRVPPHAERSEKSRVSAFPETAIALATRRTFEALSVSQRFLVKEVYEHPGTAVAFLGRTLDDMKFPPRVGIDSLNKVFTTNLVRRTPVDAEPNATVKNIVEALLESADLPSPETVRQINEETTAALTTDHNLGYESILGPLRAKLTEVVKERDNLVRERQSSVLISVCVVSLSVEPTTITRGKTLKIRYTVESSQDVADKIWLGASLPDKSQKWIFNRAQDKPIRLLKGLHEYDRDLTIPTGTAPGSYMLHASVWHGDLSDSAETNRVAKGKPVPIVIEA